MHFHLPKPLHGWREFAGEVGIIVIGVLIALAFESLVEHWHHDRQVDLARGAVRAELENAGVVAYERLAVQPCLQGRIKDLQSQLSGEGPWSGSPMDVKSNLYFNVMPVVYRAPNRPLPMDGWKAAITGGTVDFMHPETVRGLSAIYNAVADFAANQADEQRAATRLSPLAFDRPRDDNSRTQMLANLAEVDRINGLLVLDASELVEGIRSLKLGIDAREVQSDRKQVIEVQRKVRGTCVRTDMPLDLG